MKPNVYIDYYALLTYEEDVSLAYKEFRKENIEDKKKSLERN